MPMSPRYICVPLSSIGHDQLAIIWDTQEQCVEDVVRLDVDRAEWEREYGL